MTIAIAWTRSLPGNCEELILTTDSRLTGGRTIDCCPKIVTLSRSDCAVCFAGDTDYAYPLMMLLSYALENHYPSRTRALDITHLKGHILNICNQFVRSIKDDATGGTSTSIVFGGYSWINRQFKIYHYSYVKSKKMFECSDAKNYGHMGKIVIAGDWKKIAMQNLYQKLKASGAYDDAERRFDMEPFAVVRDLLRNSIRSDSIGGPIQMVKVYQHMNCRAFGVLWPDKDSGKIALSGRIIHGYERVDCRIIDPYGYMTFSPDQVINNRHGRITKKMRLMRKRLINTLNVRLHNI